MEISRRRALIAAGFGATVAVASAVAQTWIPQTPVMLAEIATLAVMTLIMSGDWVMIMLAGPESRRRLRLILAARRLARSAERDA